MDGSKHGSAWSRFHARINESADNFFYRLGGWVAHHPRRTLFVSIALVVACCFGFANFRIENDGERVTRLKIEPLVYITSGSLYIYSFGSFCLKT